MVVGRVAIALLIALVVAAGGLPDSTLADHARAVDGPHATVAVVGDVILGGTVNSLAADRGADFPLGNLAPLIDADLAIANLESVATSRGERGVEKSELVPYHFRARPETLAVLTAGGIDAVATANNHSGDFGPEAMLEQNELLDEMGIARVGSGRTRTEACAPIYLAAGSGLRVALFSADATEPHFAAEGGEPGTCHLSLGDGAAWESEFAEPIADARRHAHAVLFAIHWGDDWVAEPSREKRSLGQRLIELGVDVVLGSNAHVLQGIERHEQGLILHDLGHALAPFENAADSAIATLTVTPNGIESVALDPIVADTDRARLATGEEASRILDRLVELSDDLDTSVAEGRVSLEGGPREVSPLLPDRLVSPIPAEAPDEARDPPPGCVVDSVPEDARIEPIRVGPLTLVGAEAIRDRHLVPRLIGFDTYWTIDQPLDIDVQLVPHGTRDGTESALWLSTHDPCDWGWPTSRWEAATIYRDQADLRPPPEALTARGAASVVSGVGGPLALSVGLERDGVEIARSRELAQVELGLPVPLTAGIGVVVVVLLIGAGIMLRRRRRRA
ncbi:MAG TPA: CapA family protein [Candidatus Limnocylindria bacterium]|nr:CapA family protein [Candidatus Limnocylindria bacterium]